MKPSSHRLQNILARAGLASRRGAATIIRTGQVKVNGKVVVEPGFRVTDRDRILLNEKPVPFRIKKRYLLLNKPQGYLCSRKDRFDRSLVLDLLPPKLRKGLYPVGRLDYLSEGLILLTNDGDWAQLFLRPRHRVPKEYLVTMDWPLVEERVKLFEKGIDIKGEIYRAERVESLNSHTIRITLVEGKNREIRKVIEKLGSHVKRLIRVRIGFLTIDGLASGCWRKLTKDEVNRFREMYGRHD